MQPKKPDGTIQCIILIPHQFSLVVLYSFDSTVKTLQNELMLKKHFHSEKGRAIFQGSQKQFYPIKGKYKTSLSVQRLPFE